jgi:hypothetical protein
MPFQLHPHVTFCIIDGKAIFLDLGRDRYFALDEQAAGVFSLILEPSAGHPPDEDVDALVRHGLGERVAGEVRVEAAPASVPHRSVLQSGQPAAGISARGVVEVGAALFLARRAVRTGRLKSVIDRLGARNARGRRSGDPDRARELARTFLANRPVVPLAHNCLIDSLALMRFLARRNAHARLVFAVKLHPFAAHAWVQTDEELLNEHSDAAAEFTPILVV